MDAFAGATAVLGTRHGKERVIVPILAQELGLQVDVLDKVDTDRFGTFTREVPRVAGFRDTARTKARAALAGHPDATWGVASEGSFGPHPAMPFVPGDIELVLLVHRAGDLELFGTDVTAETNFAARAVATIAEALAFAKAARFPSHALIVMPCRGAAPMAEDIVKGITDATTLVTEVTAKLQSHGQAWLETDMRAHLNPTRMRSIERATRALARNARSTCPVCARPGFVVTEVVRGLPCAACGLPTQTPQAEVRTCEGCGHRMEQSLNRRLTPPGECGWCNP